MNKTDKGGKVDKRYRVKNNNNNNKRKKLKVLQLRMVNKLFIVQNISLSLSFSVIGFDLMFSFEMPTNKIIIEKKKKFLCERLLKIND